VRQWRGIRLMQLWKKKMTDLKIKIIDEIKKIYDPEIPVNIYELGLIYKIEIIENKIAKIEMTLTTPNCPVAESLPKLVKDNIMNVEGVTDVDLKLVWDPPWSKDRMSEAAKLELNL
jgi:FeS assembly SUF system protein